MRKMRVGRMGWIALGLAMVTGAAHAGPIEQACLASNRAGAERALCSCVQKVADITLSAADQRLVARFFADPNRAEAVRVKTSASANAFWQRYTVFGQQAELACQG